MTGDEIRTRFLEHFRSRDHRILPSASLVPIGDPSTLFISAGMQPLQPYFRGLSDPPAPRLASSQKCFRTGDLEEVGDDRHCTFFEMLGNFAPTGDYFKAEAIPWAWELATAAFEMPADRIRVTVHPTDDLAREIWRGSTGVRPEWVYDNEENWWGLASGLGPTGPDSELWWDRGPGIGCGQPDCYPDHCERFVEFWNLVFPEFDGQPDGSRIPLPRPGIDTGMGFERITAILQGADTIYGTDLYRPILDWVRASGDASNLKSERVIADHLRGACFVIADGVMPSKEGRGYVLRRLIRRALLHSRRLGLRAPLARGVAPVVDTYGRAYPDLAAQRGFIEDVIDRESRGYARTLEQGVALFEMAAAAAIISGEDAFRLHDTFGFPIELTQELAAERGLQVDWEGFTRLMAEQRRRSRGTIRESWGDVKGLPVSVFIGYRELEAETKVAAIRRGDEAMEKAGEGDEVEIYLERTPFYAESGGQVGDIGLITSSSVTARVDDTMKRVEGITAHMATIVTGSLKVGESVRAAVDAPRRRQIARHHSATHLLHQALCEVLEVDNAQRGSWVGPDHTTFDFPLERALSEDELHRISARIREKVREALPLQVREMSRQLAEDSGAKHLFEEKYAEVVRVVCFGEWTCEFCGGTHVSNTADLGTTLILSESSVGAGLRRIDLVAGEAADELLERRLRALEEVARSLGVNADEAPRRLSELRTELREAQRKIERLMDDLRVAQIRGSNAVNVRSARVKLVTEQVDAEGIDDLRAYADRYLESIGSGVVAVVGKGSFVIKASSDLADGIDVREYARLFGPGGGSPKFVQGKLTVSPDFAFEQLEAALQ